VPDKHRKFGIHENMARILIPLHVSEKNLPNTINKHKAILKKN
jgi:hypothetical protein